MWSLPGWLGLLCVMWLWHYVPVCFAGFGFGFSWLALDARFNCLGLGWVCCWLIYGFVGVVYCLWMLLVC